jgi:hypothetical protein
MILIWRGLGFWVPLIPFISLILDIFVFKSVFVFTFSATVVGYLLITYYGFKLNKNPIKKYKNVKTGEIFEVKEPHEFFFIPMQYWSIGGLSIVGLIWGIQLLKHIGTFF